MMFIQDQYRKPDLAASRNSEAPRRETSGEERVEQIQRIGESEASVSLFLYSAFFESQFLEMHNLVAHPVKRR